MPVSIVTRILPTESSEECVAIDTDTLTNCGKLYRFDKVYWRHKNEIIFNDSCREIVEKVIDGYNGTLAAYGQSGSGKTHSLLGNSSEPGILQSSVKYLLETITKRSSVRYLVKFRAYEIYLENVFDLLDNEGSKKCRFQSDEVIGGAEAIIQSYDHFNAICTEAQERRKVGETKQNQKSSRSHAVFELVVESCALDDLNPQQTTNVSKLVIVDLAGSENSRTMSNSVQTTESKAINLSLLALSRMISSIADKPNKKCVSFRDSVLTRVLQPVLNGNSNFLLICCIRGSHTSETSSTLSFGQNAKKIPIDPKKNTKTDNVRLPELLAEINDLKQQLEAQQKDASGQKKLEDLFKMVLNSNPETDTRPVPRSKRRHSIAVGACSFAPELSRRRFSDDSTALKVLIEEELVTDSGRSSRMSGRSSQMEERSTSPQSKLCQTDNLFVEKTLFDEISAICDSMKKKVKEMESKIRKRDEEEIQMKAEIQKLSADRLSLQATVESLQEKLKMQEDSEMKEKRCCDDALMKAVENAKKYEWKYNDLKKRGHIMLKEKDEKIVEVVAENALKKQDIKEKEKTIEHLYQKAKKEQAKRELVEKETMAVQKFINDALEEEKELRKKAEAEFLSEQTEKMALQEKMDEMIYSRGIVHGPSRHDYLHEMMSHRIDILIRQRKIIVDSLNDRLSE